MKKYFKRIFALFFAATVFVLGGCSSGGGGDGDTAKVLRIGVYNTTKEVNAMEQIVQSFQEKYPDFLTENGLDEIKIQTIQASNYSQKIQSMARTGTIPDVFLTIDALAPKFAQNKTSLNLNPYLEANAEYRAAVDDMYDSMKEQGVFNGEMHMVAREYSRSVIYYNKTLLTEAGLGVPENDWTYADFENYAQKLVKKNGDAVVQNGADVQLNWPSSVLCLYFGFGGSLFDENGLAALDESSAAAYSEIKALVDCGAVYNTFSGSGTSFANKTIAMTIGTRATINDMIDYFGKNSSEWGVAPFPDMTAENGNRPYIGTGTSGYSVSARSTHKDAAVQLLMYIVSEEGQKALAATGNYIPVRKSLENDACWTSGLSSEIGLPAGFNHEAYVYRTEYDLKPFSMMMKTPENQAKIISVLARMTENYLSFATNNSSLGYQNVTEWANYWNTELNKEMN